MYILKCLSSLVGKSAAWRADGRGFESHPRQPVFLSKMTISGELCCVALPFCCVIVVPFSASLGVIVHVYSGTSLIQTPSGGVLILFVGLYRNMAFRRPKVSCL